MAEEGYALSPAAVRDLLELSRRVRAKVRTHEGKPTFYRRGPPVPTWHDWVRITSLTQTAGRYPGVIGATDPTTDVVSDLADPPNIWVRGANAGALRLGRWYWGR